MADFLADFPVDFVADFSEICSADFLGGFCLEALGVFFLKTSPNPVNNNTTNIFSKKFSQRNSRTGFPCLRVQCCALGAKVADVRCAALIGVSGLSAIPSNKKRRDKENIINIDHISTLP